MNYADRLDQAVLSKGNPCLVGLDPHLALMPEEFAAVRDPEATRQECASDVTRFLVGILDAVADVVPAVKPQLAFFEVLGPEGLTAYEAVVKESHERGLIVIGDAKRGDIGSTAAAYAKAFLTGGPGSDPATLCDALTINPYLGSDSVQPFLEACDAAGAGVYILARTSNPSSAEFQTQGSPTLTERVADAIGAWGAERIGACGFSSVGAVVGATHPGELVALRERMPHTPLLLPGFGAQGATAADVVGGFSEGCRGALVNSSRGILFAFRDGDGANWKDAARLAAQQMAEELSQALSSPA
jgi:orotidine-5'-phosphate decarboxylase